MTNKPKLRLRVPLTVGGRPLPYFGEGVPFEGLLRSKVEECISADAPFFDLTMEEYEALKTHMILRLDRNNQLEDADGNMVPLDLLDAAFNETLTQLIQRWCSGAVPEAHYNPLLDYVYRYLTKKVKIILRKTYAAPELDIYDLEIEEPYYERPVLFDELEPMVLRELLPKLPKLHQEILDLRFGFTGAAYTRTEIGEMMGRTRERVRQLEEEALEKLRIMARMGPLTT